jgi:hypothetical protein|tara:strand:+ start:1869 stop:2312 length:444 start_codon:yes stop_codon:yes gene_type:complete
MFKVLLTLPCDLLFAVGWHYDHPDRDGTYGVNLTFRHDPNQIFGGGATIFRNKAKAEFTQVESPGCMVATFKTIKHAVTALAVKLRDYFPPLSEDTNVAAYRGSFVFQMSQQAAAVLQAVHEAGGQALSVCGKILDERLALCPAVAG